MHVLLHSVSIKYPKRNNMPTLGLEAM